MPAIEPLLGLNVSSDSCDRRVPAPPENFNGKFSNVELPSVTWCFSPWVFRGKEAGLQTPRHKQTFDS